MEKKIDLKSDIKIILNFMYHVFNINFQIS